MEPSNVLLALFALSGAAYCQCPEAVTTGNTRIMSCCGEGGSPIHEACFCSDTPHDMDITGDGFPYCGCPKNEFGQCCGNRRKRESLNSLNKTDQKRFHHQTIEKTMVEQNVDAVNDVLRDCLQADYILTLAGFLYGPDLNACSDAIYSSTSTAKQIQKKCKLLDKKLKAWPMHTF